MRVVAAFCLLAFPATAEPWACHFTAECMAGLACEEAAWDLEIIAADHEGQLFMSSIVSDVIVTRLTARSYATEDTLITIGLDGTAILSTHTEAVLTYFGTCEAL